MFPVAILAGGLATRLHPLTETIPKALVDVNGEPFVAHQLRLLHASGIERAVLCVGHLGEVIQGYVGSGERFGLRVDFSFDGEQLLGTGGAIKHALPMLGEAFFVLYGDSYLPCDYRAIQAAFVASKRLALMTVFRNENRWDTSNVALKDGRIVAYDKRRPTPEMNHIDYGLGVFRREAFEAAPNDEACDLAALYRYLLRAGELSAFEVDRRFYEIGSFDGLRDIREYLAGRAGESARRAE
jgi:NDP-sugar pyrophosphorylase family protein